MKNNIIKKITMALILSLGITSVHANRYTYDEVSEACANAYNTNQQIGTCIYNVCREYGCSLGGAPISG